MKLASAKNLCLRKCAIGIDHDTFKPTTISSRTLVASSRTLIHIFEPKIA